MKRIFNLLTLWIGLFVSSMLFIGCDGHNPLDRQSNPLTDHPGLADSVPLHGKKQHQQLYAGDLFSLTVAEREDGNLVLNFSEGQTSNYTLQLRCYVDGAIYTLKTTNVPQGVELKQDTTKADTWFISWTPGNDLIPEGKSFLETQMELEFVIDTDRTPPQVVETFKNKDLSIRVPAMVHLQKLPITVGTVTEIEGKSFNLGEQIPFSIDVTDPVGRVNEPPVVQITYDRSAHNSEKKSINASAAALPDLSKPVETVSAQQWRYHFVLDTSILKSQINQSQSGSIGVFHVYAISQRTGMNTLVQVTFSVRGSEIREDSTMQNSKSQPESKANTKEAQDKQIVNSNGKSNSKLKKIKPTNKAKNKPKNPSKNEAKANSRT